MSLVTTPYSSEHWVQQWTMFYWAWGLSWAPFVGSFIARISRGTDHPRIRAGRDDRAGRPEHAVVLDFRRRRDPLRTVRSCRHRRRGRRGSSGRALCPARPTPGRRDRGPGRPLRWCAMFVITSADSATFVLGMFTSKGVLNPTRFVRILWGSLQLLMAGGAVAQRRPLRPADGVHHRRLSRSCC